jgi:hypothetical protein
VRVTALALVVLAVAACGGGARPQEVSGDGFSFSVPGGWHVQKATRSVTAAPAHGDELLSVYVDRLQRPYRPALWPRAARELDGVAAGLAEQLDEGRVTARRTVRLAGLPGRSYDLAYLGKGGSLVERIVFLLEQRREYQLLCRWSASSPKPGQAACEGFHATFALG